MGGKAHCKGGEEGEETGVEDWLKSTNRWGIRGRRRMSRFRKSQGIKRNRDLSRKGEDKRTRKRLRTTVSD